MLTGHHAGWGANDFGLKNEKRNTTRPDSTLVGLDRTPRAFERVSEVYPVLIGTALSSKSLYCQRSSTTQRADQTSRVDYHGLSSGQPSVAPQDQLVRPHILICVDAVHQPEHPSTMQKPR